MRFRTSSLVVTAAMVAVLLPVLPEPPRPSIVHRWVPLGDAHVQRVRAPVPFSMLGVTWAQGAGSPDEIEVRTSEDGRRWSRWTELELLGAEGPDPGREGGRTGTAPLWVGRARSVELRGRLPRGARLNVIDPGDDPGGILPEAAAMTTAPGIVSRRSWGADERIRRDNPSYAGTVKAAFVHHTATGNSYAPSDVPRIIRSIYAYHVKSNGWDDIGYNLLIDRFGRVYEGRYGGVDKAVIGAHTGGFNTGSTGVSVIGTFGSARPPDAAMTALKKLLAWKLDLTHVDPTGRTSFTSKGNSKFAAGRVVTLPTIAAHRDASDTSCPGGAFYNALAGLRSAVRPIGDPKIFGPVLDRASMTPNGDGVADTIRLKAGFSSVARWTIDVVDHVGVVHRTFTGTGSSADVTWNGKNGAGAVLPHDAYTLRVRATNPRGSARGANPVVNVRRYANGAMFAAPSGFYVLERGQLRKLSGRAAAASRYRPGQAVAASDGVRSLYPAGSSIGFREGTIVRSGGRLYVISEGLKRSTSDAALRGMGIDPAAAVTASGSELAVHPSGGSLGPGSQRPPGTAVRSSSGAEGWMLRGAARPFLTSRVRTSYAIRDIDLAGPADLEILSGSITRPLGFRDGTLARTPTGPVYFVSDGLRRRVTSDRRLKALGYDASDVITVTDAELALHTEGAPL